MNDYVTINHLRDIGFNWDNDEVVNKITVIESLQRTLDKPVNAMHLLCTNNDTVVSIQELFTVFYNDAYSTATCDTFCVDLPMGDKGITKSAYATLKSLLFLCTHKDAELAKAASVLFQRFTLFKDLKLTTEMFYELVESYKPVNYYETQLLQSIRKSAFNYNETVLHWHKVADCNGWYKIAIKAGEDYINNTGLTVKDLDKQLSQAYKDASKDKEWMSLLIKKLPSKQLIGMMWLLYPNNPDVLKESEGGDFMQVEEPLSSVRTKNIEKIARQYVYPMLMRQGQKVSVEPEVSQELIDETAIYHAKVIGCSTDEALAAIAKTPSNLIISDTETANLHVAREGKFYVCKWK